VAPFGMTSRLIAVVVSLLLPATAGFGQWLEKSSRVTASVSPRVTHRYVALENPAGDTAELELALMPAGKSDLSLRLIDNPDGSSDLAGAMVSNGCIAGVNGGYFDPEFLPMGLRIANGKVVRSLRRARLLTGILAAGSGSVKILRLSEYSSHAKIITAVQCGPLLVDAGRPVVGLERTRLARRTFAVVGTGIFGIGVLSEVTLADAAAILSSIRLGENVPVSRALNLDGGSSSAFWLKRANGTVISQSELKTVRDFIGIAAK
jgi:uncharacterized protein YigE (DUF2233 family)